MRKDNVPGRLGIAFAVATCLAVPAFTQQPTFKVSVNVVDVDVTVTDGEGNFVSDLRAEDFEVLEDGKPQTIQTFSAIELPVQRRTSFEFGGRPVPADVRSNRDVESGRVYIILLDDLNVARCAQPWCGGTRVISSNSTSARAISRPWS